jgi:protein TonB
MTLAAILGMYALLATVPPGSFHAQPGLISQASSTQQDAPQSRPAQPLPPSEPQPSSQPEPTPPAPQEATPDQPATPQSTPAQDSKQPPEASQAPATEVKPESKPSPTKKSKKRSKKAAAKPGNGPTKTVVRNGGTVDPEVQLSPGVSQEQASRQRKNTSQLLETTEANLRKISVRQLDATQQDMVKQIRAYMDQAKTAAGSGDLQRARNLAFKAHLLSAELLQH